MPATRLLALFTLLALLLSAGGATAQDDDPPASGQGAEPLASLALAGSAFTYQGWLQSGGHPVSAACDFQFSLHEAVSGGAQLGSTQSMDAVVVAGGRFTVVLNEGDQFGPRAFDGSARWLAIAVRCPAGVGGFINLTPRQALTAAPLALSLPGLRTEPNASSPNVVGGHISNTVSVGFVGATIAGGGTTGLINSVTAHYGTVGGGYSNTAGASFATVGGGQGNTAGGSFATVSGGQINTASGAAATVAGGVGNIASGSVSFAAGANARATHSGSWVWACSTCATTYSPASNTFAANATGRFWFGNVASAAGSITPTIGAGNFISTSTGARLTTAGVWTNASDRHSKTAFAPVDGVAVLNALADLPITSWTYNVESEGIRHIGPTAQDFYAAFGLGDSDTSIGTVDADGVALAAIQGLHALVQQKNAEAAAQQSEIAALSERLAALESGLMPAGGVPAGGGYGQLLLGLLLGLLFGAAIGAGAFALGRRRQPAAPPAR
jgi:trimeric autotransporter adhesin